MKKMLKDLGIAGDPNAGGKAGLRKRMGMLRSMMNH